MLYRCSVIVLLAVLLLAACNPARRPRQDLLTIAALPQYSFTINTKKDTALRTPGGSIIRIKAGSISSNTNEVTLAVKEALRPADMLLAGLATESNGAPLTSGGMIYINATTPATLSGSIDVALPSATLLEEMQLYKGELQPDSSINWVNPDTLPRNAFQQQLQEGKQLFNTNCASCHGITKKLTAPALAGLYADVLREKGSRFAADHYLIDFTRNSAALFAKGDARALRVYYEYNGTGMNAFPMLTDEQILNIFRYADNYAYGYAGTFTDTSGRCADSCRIYKEQRAAALQQFWRADTIQPGNTAVNNATAANQFTDPVTSGVEQGLRSGFADGPLGNEGYYEFSINTFGWYNIDAGVAGLPGTEQSKVEVEIKNAGDASFNMYLYVPAQKMLSVSNHNNGAVYGFHKEDELISLPQRTKAYAVAFTDKGDKVLWGVASFTTDKAVRAMMIVKETSPEEFLKAMQSLELQGIDFSVERVPAPVVAQNQPENTATAPVNNAQASPAATAGIDSVSRAMDSVLQVIEQRYKPRNCVCEWPAADSVKAKEP